MDISVQQKVIKRTLLNDDFYVALSELLTAVRDSRVSTLDSRDDDFFAGAMNYYEAKGFRRGVREIEARIKNFRDQTLQEHDRQPDQA